MVAEFPTGWTVIEIPSPPWLLLAVGSEMCGRGSAGDLQQGVPVVVAGQARGLQGAMAERPGRGPPEQSAMRQRAPTTEGWRWPPGKRQPRHRIRREQWRSFRPPASFRVLLWSIDPNPMWKKLQTSIINCQANPMPTASGATELKRGSLASICVCLPMSVPLFSFNKEPWKMELMLFPEESSSFKSRTKSRDKSSCCFRNHE